MADLFLHTELLDGHPVIRKEHHVFAILSVIVAMIIVGGTTYWWLTTNRSVTPNAPVVAQPSPSSTLADRVGEQLSTAPVSNALSATAIQKVSAQLTKPPSKTATVDQSAIERQLQSAK